jgi:hypothetical protein
LSMKSKAVKSLQKGQLTKSIIATAPSLVALLFV